MEKLTGFTNTETLNPPLLMSHEAISTDASIARAIAGGGKARELALQQWFADEGLQRWVRNYATRNGGSETDAEDLYHDTFITFDRLLREGKFRAESSLKTFFCSIAKWQWLNKLRKKGRVAAMDSADLLEIAQFPEQEMYERERQQVFEKLLSSMGSKCKRILGLYQLSYSMKEIATEMGYSSDQVAMNQCSECRKKLKALIENSQEIKDFFNV